MLKSKEALDKFDIEISLQIWCANCVSRISSDTTNVYVCIQVKRGGLGIEDTKSLQLLWFSSTIKWLNSRRINFLDPYKPHKALGLETKRDTHGCGPWAYAAEEANSQQSLWNARRLVRLFRIYSYRAKWVYRSLYPFGITRGYSDCVLA